MSPASSQTAADRWRAWLNLVLSVTQPAAAGLPRIGIGVDIGARSDAAATLVTPPGWSFAIWGVLYPACIAYGVHQFRPARRADPLLRTVGWATAGAFLFNTAWAVEVVTGGITLLSVAIIVLLLACLAYAVVALGRDPPETGAERYLVAAPISALAGWITAAAVVNVASALDAAGVGGGGQTVALAVAAIAVGALAAIGTVALNGGNPWFAGVTCWALVGVAFGHERRPEAWPIMAACAVGSAVVILVCASRLRRPGALRAWLGMRSRPSSPEAD